MLAPPHQARQNHPDTAANRLEPPPETAPIFFLLLRNAYLNPAWTIILQDVVDAIKQRAQSNSLHRRNVDSVLIIAQGLPLLGQQQINFIITKAAASCGLKFLQHTLNLRVLLGRDRTAGI